eukprot:jgi/Mesvir1/13557/Mv12446-RA.1
MPRLPRAPRREPCGRAPGAAPTVGTTLAQVVAVQEMGAIIMARVPLIERVRLRALSHHFLSAVDASLASQTSIGPDLGLNTKSKKCGHALPWLLSKCPRLESLHLQKDWLHGITADKVLHALAAHCHHLQHLHFASPSVAELYIGLRTTMDYHRNRDKRKLVSDAALVAVAVACPGLRQIDLSGYADITDASLAAVGKSCPLLEHLGVSACGMVTDAGVIAVVSSCSRLTHLAADGCDVGDPTLLAISRNCPNMVHISMDSCPNVGEAGILAVTKGCPLLKTIKIYKFRVMNDLTVNTMLRYGRSISELKLDHTEDVTDAAFEELGDGCQQLEVLEVKECHNFPFDNWTGLTDRGITSLVRCCRKLTHVEIDHLDIHGSDATMTALAENSPGLRHLSVHRWKMTDEGIQALALHCPLLTTLKLLECDNVTDEGLSQLVASLSQLEELRLATTPAGNKTLVALGSHCPRLTQLDVSYQCGWRNGPVIRERLGKVDDTGVAALLTGCPNLRDLDLSYRAKVTGSAFSIVRPGNLALERLRINSCTKFTAEGVMNLEAKCPGLRGLGMRECPCVRRTSVKAIVTKLEKSSV